MSVFSWNEDSIKTNLLMEEGDSSLEPGEVKTPPHGIETTKPKVAEEAIKMKCNTSHYLPHSKSASKQEIDKCAEKVRAILEIDAMKRKEELERRKEQKSETLLLNSTTRKKDHKKHKIHKREPKNVNFGESKTEKFKDAVIIQTKNKKSKHEEPTSYSRHPTAETCESMRPISSATSLSMLPQLNFVTALSNASPNFSRRFSDLNNPTTYRSYNPFMRNYRTDFRHKGNNFITHNRTRFSRYRSQYISGSFHAPAEEPNHSSPPHSNVPYSQLLWTKTKPSISYALNLHEHDVVTYKRNSSEISVQKKKKYKKSKEREESNKSSPKSSRKSSKRKKIRKIRETLQPVKNQMISPSHEPATLTTDNRVYTTAVVNKTTENSDCTANKGDTPNQCSIILCESDKAISERLESKTEHSKLVDKASGDSGRSQILDMFASLTPPKQKSPPMDFKVTLNTSSNLQITNKLQEIQDRIDKLLEDDELKLEDIQATKDKLLQKSREHTENINLSKSSKQNKILSPSNNSLPLNIVKSHDKLIDTSFVSKSSFSAKSKDKSPLDIFNDTKKDNRKQYTKGEKELTATKTLHSKILHSTTPNVKQRNENRSINTKVKSNKNKIFILKKDSLEDSPSNVANYTTCAMDGSPDTDDYSDDWENDDEEIDMSSAFQNISQLELSKHTKNLHNIKSSPSSSLVDSVDSESNSKMQSTTPKNSPPQQRLSPKFSYTPRESPKANIDNQETDEMQRLYNQFIKSVENANIKIEESKGNDTHIEIKKEKENENENEALSASSASYSSSSSSTSDTSISSSGSSSTTSSSDSASDDSNDTDMIQNNVSHFACNDETAIETTNNDNNAPPDKEKTKQLLTTKEESKPNVVKDLKKLESLEANLLRIQMMRANYDSADEISDELLKMEKLFLHEKNIILNKFMSTSISKSEKKEKQDNELDIPIQSSIESLQSTSLSKGQFVQSMQKLQNKDDKSQVSNIFDTNREVIKLTISPVKLPKTSAIFEADNEMEITKQAIETCEKTNSAVKPPKPMKEVAIVKPIMESKEPPSAHHQKRRRSPLPTHHALQSRSRSRRGRVRSLSVSPSRNNSGRCASPQRRGGFLKQSRNRNYERRSRSRSPSVIRPLSRRSGDISPNSRKRRTILNVDDRSRKHSPRRDSRSRSPSSPPPRHRSDRYSRSPLPFKPPSPPTDPYLSPSNIHRSSLSPVRRLRSNSRSPRKVTVSPSTKSHESDRHRSLSPKHKLYKQHSPRQSNASYYFNHSPSRISLDARINIVLNGPSSSHNESNSITTYEDYSQYGQYGPATYMSLPSDSNSFYTNQYVPMANTGATVPQTNISQHTYSNLPTIGNDESELFSSIPHHVNVNATNFYYNRFGTQPFGLNQPSPLLKELPKATVAVQKGNVLEIVPCSDLLPNNTAENTNENEIHNKKGGSKQEDMEEAASSNSEKRKRSILKPLDEETNSLRNVFVGASKKKKVNFEDGVFPNHNSDEEDRKVIEAKIRVKMRRLRKKLGVTPPCHNLIEDKARKERQKADTDKKAPPPPPNGFVPPNLEQPIYLRTHTPTPLLYFHFDGVVHSMYVSQMERPIPPRLLNQKCLSSSNINVVSQHTDSQSPLYMQSPISAGAPHLHTSKKDPIATFTRLNRTENISPKAIPSTTALQQAAGSPKINYKMYSPIESIHHTEIGSSALPSTSPNSIKGNTIHIISSTAIANHFLPKRQESPKDPVSVRTNMSMGLLPVPTTHPSMAQNSGVAQHTRIPVIGVPPTVIPKVGSSVSEQFMGGFASTMIQNCHQPITNLNQNYLVPSSVAHTNNPHMPSAVQQYFNTPVQRMHRPFQNFMTQQAQPSPIAPNLPMYHMVEPIETTNADLDKFANPQNMTIPYSYKGP